MPTVVGRCANPTCKAPEGRLLRYLDGTVCAFGACQAFAATQVAARRAMAVQDVAADGADAAEQCYFVESVLGVRECDPKQLSVPKRRAEALDAEDQDIAYEVRGWEDGVGVRCLRCR